MSAILEVSPNPFCWTLQGVICITRWISPSYARQSVATDVAMISNPAVLPFLSDANYPAKTSASQGIPSSPGFAGRNRVETRMFAANLSG
jgi:hypothetical protein